MKAALFLFVAALAASSGAEEYGVLVTVTGETPVAVPFLRCEKGKRDAATESAPATCRDRETRDSFYVETARVTNLGDTIVWVHVGDDKLPVLPGTTYNVWGAPKSKFKRVFLSAGPEQTAFVHVFASDPLQHDRVPEPRENERAR
jgi:hypothetical protein